MDEDQEQDQESHHEEDETEVEESSPTINISDIRHGSIKDHNDYEEKYISSRADFVVRSRGERKSRQKFSQVWTKFTIVDNRLCLASCNVCGAKLSYKTTITNLQKHLVRKHNYNTKGFGLPYQQKKKAINYESHHSRQNRKRTLTELGGLDGLLLNVVADEGEDPLEQREVDSEQVVYAEEVGEYTYTVGGGDDEANAMQRLLGLGIRAADIGNEYDSDKDPEYQPGKDDYDSEDDERHKSDKRKSQGEKGQTTPSRSTPARPSERRNLSLESKRERMLDLQLECLDLKKYTMQLEALAMEHQLNVPRSMFTESLRGSNNTTRGTQTDVGGGNTKVFYVSDKNVVNGDHGSPQLFTFHARTAD